MPSRRLTIDRAFIILLYQIAAAPNQRRRYSFMSFLSRVVWSEGMYLAPHHFQRQSRYFEDSIEFAASAFAFQRYGLVRCALDADALRNGTIRVVHACGLYPDGLTFDMPECDALPPVRAIADRFPPTRESAQLLLAIPERRADGSNCALTEENSGVRFRAVTQQVPDDNTGRDERPVMLGAKNFQLLLETEPRDGLTVLPIANIVRDGAGGFALDPDFIPPCVQITASERLMLLTGRLVEILEQKSAALTRAATGAATVGGYSPREISAFWLLHAVNSGLAALHHLWASKRGHPEELFMEMLRLGGALCTFAVDSHPRLLPVYDHERLTECFAALDDHIRRHLDILLPTNCLAIPLSQTANYFYDGEIGDTRCFGPSRWILGIQAGVGEVDLISKTPQLAKVCSTKFVGELVKRALPGLSLTHVPTPPSAVPTRVESQYFVISKAGPFWENIVQTRHIGVYVPGDLPDPRLELFVLLDA